MIRTDVGAGAASARYPVSSTPSGQSARRDPSAAAGADPFGDLVDRYSDDAPGNPSTVGSPRARTQAGTAVAKQPQRPAAPDARVSEDTATVGHSRSGKSRVSADEDAQDKPHGRRASTDEAVDADAALMAAAPPVLSTVVTDDRLGEAGKSAQALSGLVEAAVSQPAGSGVSAEIAEGQKASALADRADNALAELAGAVQTQEPSIAEGIADGQMPVVHAHGADAPADPAGDSRRAAIDALRRALANDAAKTIAGKPAGADTVDAAPGKADVSDVARANKTTVADAGSIRAGVHATPGGGQDLTAAGAVVDQASVENQSGNDANQSQNESTDDRHDAFSDAATNRAESASARGTRTHGSGKQIAQASQEPGRAAHIPTHIAASSEASHKHASQENDTSVALKPTARAAQAIAAFQAASMANMTGSAAAVRAQVGTTSTATPALLDAELPTQLIHAIRVQVDGGTSEARVQLNPGFLGNVSVGVRMEAGAVVASLQASDPQVREWMRTNEPMLRQNLADQGLQLERLVIVEEEPQPSGDGREERREPPQQQQAPRPRRRPSTEGTFELVL